MRGTIAVALCSTYLLSGLVSEFGDLVRSASASPVVGVESRRAALAKIPPYKRKRWCQAGWKQAKLARKATIRGPVRRQRSNAQNAGNALFGNIEAYYAGHAAAAVLIRETLEEGARIGAFTELTPYRPPEYPDNNVMNEPVFQVSNFLVPLTHGYLILKEEYSHQKELLSDVKRWGNRLFEITRKTRVSYGGKAKGTDLRAHTASGWAHWGGAVNNRAALASAKKNYIGAVRSIGRGGVDRIWKHQGRLRIRYVDMTVGAALAAGYALRRAGMKDVYTLAPKRGTIVQGAAWLWDQLVQGQHSNLLRTRDPGTRSVAWIEYFIREFPRHPSAGKMRSWRSKTSVPLYANMTGGPTTCLYRRIPRNP